MTEGGSTPTPTDQDQAVATRLHSVAIHLLRRLRREDAALGISAARLSALSVVVFAGPVTLGELAAAEDVTPPTMTRLVAALEAEGLVTRTADAGDRRVTRVRATAKGRRIMERGRSRRTAHLAAQLATLGREDLVVLDRAATILEDLIERRHLTPT